jgi:CheY-like chemotaxis protein
MLEQADLSGPSSQPFDPDPPLVLLAEDDDDMRMLIATMLRRDGYDVLEAEDGEAMEFLLEVLFLAQRLSSRPTMVLSDIRMPGFSGLDLVARLREHDWLVPVILITGFGDTPTRRAAERLGVAAVFDKPLSLDKLLDRVHELVPQAQA